MDSSFTDDEKRFVLAEIIKASRMDVGVLVNLIRSHDIQPDWLSMQLPRGRNVNQCIHAAEAMFNAPMPPPLISPLKRKSFGDVSDQLPKRQALASPSEPPPHGSPYHATPAFAQHHVNIHHPNGQPTVALAPNPNTVPASAPTPYPGPPRRRGRPPKSENRSGHWQITTSYPNITPAPIAPAPAPAPASAPQPSSPSFRAQAPIAPAPAPTSAPAQAATSAPQPNSPSFRVQPYNNRYSMPAGPLDSKSGKKLLPEIAPRPTHGTSGLEQPARSPTRPVSEYQDRREDIHRLPPPQAQGPSRHAMRDPPLLPPPQSPRSHPHPPPHHIMDASRPRETPPPTPMEPVKHESHLPPPPTKT
ncbi:uncharacterized protein QC764_707715 [Podospora pseudoanserina]|uniref:Uncharacterized protein n=1 Tax=Podospora pseudoanserina TaxID=2609844 RepID=A0ABR0HKU3_9PEZI|nr:hypothetical protein QC764_707715 [Podospora pseudoanserina]